MKKYGGQVRTASLGVEDKDAAKSAGQGAVGTLSAGIAFTMTGWWNRNKRLDSKSKARVSRHPDG